MSRYLSGRAPIVIAFLAAFASTLGVWLAFSVYHRHNQAQCGGALGWLADVGAVVIWLAFAALFTLISILHAIGTALVRRRWIWTGALIVAMAVGCFGLAESTSEAAHTAIAFVSGGGCSWFWPFPAENASVLFVALFALGSVLVEARRS